MIDLKYSKFLKKALFTTLLLSIFSTNANELGELYEKALISFQKNEVSTATIHLKNALKMQNNHVPSRILMAQIHIKNGDGAAAEIELKKAQENHADMDRLVTLYAHSYILQSKYDEVLEVTKPRSRGSKIESELLVLRGQALIGQRLYKSADKAFEEALFLRPTDKFAYLGRAQVAVFSRDTEQAMSYLNKALEIDANFVNAWIFKANLLSTMAKTNQAITAVDKALSIENEHMLARLTKATLHISLKEYAAAEPHVDFILKKIPNEPRAGYLKSLINASKDDSNENDAESKLTEVIATLSAVPDEVMKNTPDYYYLAGLTNYEFGNYEDAKRYLRKYLDYVENHLDSIRMIGLIELQEGSALAAKQLLTKANIAIPNNGDIMTLLGMAYLQLQETRKAEAYFQQVLELFPGSEVGITNLAKSKMQSGEFDSAIDALLSIKDNEINSTQIKILLIDSYEKSGDLNKAIKVANELVEEFPKESYFHQRLGILLGLSNQIAAARQAFENALLLDENNIAAIIHLARMNTIEGKLDVTRSYLNQKLKVFENNTLLMAELADTYFIVQDYQTALQILEKANSLEPSNFYVFSKLASVLVALKHYDKAIELADYYIGQNPKEIKALPIIADLYVKTNKGQQAILAMRDFVKKSINKVAAYIKLAKVQVLIGDKFGAIQSYKKATVVDNLSLSAHIGLVNLVIENGDESYARYLIETIYKLTESQSLIDILTGDLYLSLDKPKLAGDHYLKALESSNQKQSIVGLYHSYIAQHRAKEVIPYIERWLSHNPSDLVVNITLADAYKHAGSLDKACKLYDAMIANFGNLPILLNNAANAYYLNGDKNRAKELAQRAYDYVENNVAIMDTLAWIESRMGNHEKALGLFRNALTQDFDNAEIKYHLAVTLKALGRDSEAKNYLIEAIDSKQKFADKDKAKTLLENWL